MAVVFRPSRFAIIIVTILVVVILGHYIGFLRPVENAVIFVLSPVQRVVYGLGVGINGIYSKLPFGGGDDPSPEQLEEEIKKLVIENNQLKTLIAQQQLESVQQGFLDANGLQAVSARVIGKNPEPNLQTIIIDKGEGSGAVVGLPVISDNGVLIGKISSVRKNSSEVVLVSDSRSTTAAMIQNEAGSKGVVVGEHGLSLKMELLLKNEPVVEGDVVITSGLETFIPRGLVIGRISRLTTEPNAFAQTAWIQPLVQLDSLLIVSILTSPSYAD
jgi:rod shape-determining protein MreC